MGIISSAGAMPLREAMRSTMGTKMATTPVELMKAPRNPTANINNTSSRHALSPP